MTVLKHPGTAAQASGASFPKGNTPILLNELKKDAFAALAMLFVVGFSACAVVAVLGILR